MSTPMHDVPDHLAMEVDIDGRGPADPAHAVAVICWCGIPGCTAYAPVDRGPGEAVTCRRCGVTGICTPHSDYYTSPLWTGEGRVCEPCLMALVREAK